MKIICFTSKSHIFLTCNSVEQANTEKSLKDELWDIIGVIYSLKTTLFSENFRKIKNFMISLCALQMHMLYVELRFSILKGLNWHSPSYFVYNIQFWLYFNDIVMLHTILTLFCDFWRGGYFGNLRAAL